MGTATLAIAVDACVGIAIHKLLPEFSIYPNPTTGKFFVRCQEGGLLSMRNDLGQLVYEQVLSGGENVIDPVLLPKGIYIVYLTKSGETFQGKLIKY
jgi:hypothetical protein